VSGGQVLLARAVAARKRSRAGDGGGSESASHSPSKCSRTAPGPSATSSNCGGVCASPGPLSAGPLGDAASPSQGSAGEGEARLPRVGDHVGALLPRNGKTYPAVVREVLEDSEHCVVTWQWALVREYGKADNSDDDEDKNPPTSLLPLSAIRPPPPGFSFAVNSRGERIVRPQPAPEVRSRSSAFARGVAGGASHENGARSPEGPGAPGGAQPHERFSGPAAGAAGAAPPPPLVLSGHAASLTPY